MLDAWVGAVRKNHALEHATVAVLLARHGPMRVAGRASPDGFYLFGSLREEDVDAAAREALRRLRAGESSLAVSPHCGTNIAVAGFAAGLAAAAVVSTGPAWKRFPNAVTAAMLAVVAAQPVGRRVQRHLTTSADLGDVEIVGTRSLFGSLKKVQTRLTAAP